MEAFLTFVSPDLMILVAVVYGLGLFLKKSERVADWLIPLILLASSIILCIVYTAIVLEGGFVGVTIINGLTEGVIIASIAVFGDQVVKQYFEKRFIDKNK